MYTPYLFSSMGDHTLYLSSSFSLSLTPNHYPHFFIADPPSGLAPFYSFLYHFFAITIFCFFSSSLSFSLFPPIPITQEDASHLNGRIGKQYFSCLRGAGLRSLEDLAFIRRSSETRKKQTGCTLYISSIRFIFYSLYLCTFWRRGHTSIPRCFLVDYFLLFFLTFIYSYFHFLSFFFLFFSLHFLSLWDWHFLLYPETENTRTYTLTSNIWHLTFDTPKNYRDLCVPVTQLNCLKFKLVSKPSGLKS